MCAFVKDITARECSDVAHIEPIIVTEYMDNVELDYKGKCSRQTLEQDQKVSFTSKIYQVIRN